MSAEPPAPRFVAGGGVAQPRQPRNDLAVTQREKIGVELSEIRVGSGEAAVDAAALESFERKRIGNRCAGLFGGESGEMGEFAAPALPDGIGEGSAAPAIGFTIQPPLSL